MARSWRGALLAMALALPGACDDPAAGSGDVAADMSDADVDAGGDAASTGDAGDAADAPEVTPVVFCEGPTAYDYDPLTAPELATFPDDLWTADDASRPTGLRVVVDGAPWLPQIPETVSLVFEQLGELDGFGTTAGIVLRFTTPVGDVPSGEQASLMSDALQLWDLGPATATGEATPERVPFEVQITDEGSTVILMPMVPLRPKHRHAALLTTSHVTPEGDCVAPSPTLRHLLTGTAADPALSRLHGRYAEMLEATGVGPGEVSAAVVFTTQSIVESSVTIAEDVATRDFAWAAPPDCVDEAEFRVCEGRFAAWDYRDADGILRGTEPVAGYELPVTLWLPLGDPPAEGFPTMVFGHGLSSGRSQGVELAELAAPLGFATVAVDATWHGEHPAGSGDDALMKVISFFGLTLDPLGVDGLVLRDNWRQSTYDKLQLVRLLTQHPDTDGDGQPELDPSKLVYLGASLGGIMGSELLALTDRFQMGILMVAGGRVATIIQEAEQFEIIIVLAKPEGMTDGDVDRFFPVLQTLVEAGDSANYAPYVLQDRLAPGGATPPHLLVTNAIDDDTVPPGTNRMLARAFRTLLHVPPVLEPIGIIHEAEAAPVAGNLPGGTTAGLFQFDRITKSVDGPVQKAKHGNVPASRESFAQVEHLLQTWLDGATPEIIDPYQALGTPPLRP